MKRMWVIWKISSSGDTGGLLHLSRTDICFLTSWHDDNSNHKCKLLISNSLNMVTSCFWLCRPCAFLYCNTCDGTFLHVLYIYCDTLNPGFKKQQTCILEMLSYFQSVSKYFSNISKKMFVCDVDKHLLYNACTSDSPVSRRLNGSKWLNGK